MAAIPLTIAVSPVKRFKSGNLFVNMAAITISAGNTYPDGGFDLTPAKLGLDVVHGATCESSSGYKFLYDAVEKKLIAFEFPGSTAGPATEVSDTNEAAGDLAAATLHIVAMGR